MTITLNQLIPIPLKERLLPRHSDVWNNHFTIEQGAFVKLKAPSGSGKTTLVHIVYKLREDYTGSVTFDGIPVREITGDVLADFRQQQLSIVFQDLRLFPNLTARENIELNRVLQEPYYESSMIDTMAEQLGITHVLQQKVGICSYGEQQRVAIIRALMQPFSWLILDEPFSHLDKTNTHKAVELIAAECRKRNAGMLITDLDDDEHFSYNRQYQL
jgi:ABC-type lipoprotein export system ATPase subunit